MVVALSKDRKFTLRIYEGECMNIPIVFVLHYKLRINILESPVMVVVFLHSDDCFFSIQAQSQGLGTFLWFVRRGFYNILSNWLIFHCISSIVNTSIELRNPLIALIRISINVSCSGVQKVFIRFLVVISVLRELTQLWAVSIVISYLDVCCKVGCT